MPAASSLGTYKAAPGVIMCLRDDSRLLTDHQAARPPARPGRKDWCAGLSQATAGLLSPQGEGLRSQGLKPQGPDPEIRYSASLPPGSLGATA